MLATYLLICPTFQSLLADKILCPTFQALLTQQHQRPKQRYSHKISLFSQPPPSKSSLFLFSLAQHFPEIGHKADIFYDVHLFKAASYLLD